MKKLAIYFMAASLSFTFIPLSSHAATRDEVPGAVAPVSPDINRMISRVNEIKEMDRSNLSSAEKKDLRKELRSLKHELKKSGKGVYLSIGAIIIIILLLILIL
jgi:hypothetical protein